MDSLVYLFGGSVLLMLVWIIALIIAFLIGLNVVYEMAKRRGRAAGAWTLLSLFTTPFLMMAYLACLGETGEQKGLRIYQEEKIREKARKGEAIN